MRKTLTINDTFFDLVENTDRYLVLKGGAGSGKSVFAAQKILTRIITENTNHRFLVVRKVGNTIEGSAFKLFKDIISSNDISHLFSENKSTHSFRYGNSEIITSGLDDVEKLKSIHGVTGIWIEEATELAQADFTQLDLRLRGETKYYKQIILTFNPISETHWLKKKFWDNKPDNCTLHHSTYLDNKFIDAEYVKMLNEQISGDDNLSRIYLRGEWGRPVTGAEFYNAFKYNHHTKPQKYNKEGYTHLSFDQNVVPYITATISQITREKDVYTIHFIDEFCLKNPKNTTEALCREILSKYDIKHVYYYGDASGRKRDTRGRDNDYDIIARMFQKQISNNSDRVPKANPGLIKRREFINAIFNEKLPIRIEIDPKCTELIADMESVIEDVDGSKLKRKVKDKESGQVYEEHSHASDTLDYVICEAFRSYFENYRPIK